jgi:hypothetical protein
MNAKAPITALTLAGGLATALTMIASSAWAGPKPARNDMEK